MPEFRKTFRTYYKILDNELGMVKVENLSKGSTVSFTENHVFVDGILFDPVYGACTEQEFNEAKSIAVGRIGLEKIES